MNTSSRSEPVVRDAPCPAATGVTHLPINDPAARMYLLTRLILSFDQPDKTLLATLIEGGFTPELIDKLRGMSMVDALRFTASHCGLALSVDGAAVRHQLGNMERMKADRELYEYFIRAGASPNLISRLFGVSSDDVRRLRKHIAPTVATGGRPRTPAEPIRSQIEAAWDRIRRTEPSERNALWLLHQEFNSLSLATLETTVRGATERTAPAWPARTYGWSAAAQAAR